MSKPDKLSLKKLLASKKFPELEETSKTEKQLHDLQLLMLRTQQGVWHQKKRVIIALEGFDAAGKGGAIRRTVELLDPRGFRVYPIGPPNEIEQNKHYLFRFWKRIPDPGTIAIFDRTWYGRVLVERVEKLIPKQRWNEAYGEINTFEKTLANDGIHMIKIFLAIDKDEQLERFKARLKDPYKRWKITKDDVKARKQWNDYVEAANDMIQETNTPFAPWHLVAANDKAYTRIRVLSIILNELSTYTKWMEGEAQNQKARTLDKALHELGVKKF